MLCTCKAFRSVSVGLFGLWLSGLKFQDFRVVKIRKPGISDLGFDLGVFLGEVLLQFRVWEFRV